MKIKYADKSEDNDVLESEYVMMDSINPKFEGIISLVHFIKVRNNFIAKRPDGSLEDIFDDDFELMIYFPKDKKYSLSVFYDANERILQWYFDVIDGYCGYEGDMPFFKDMYLDYVVLPDKTTYVLDEDELEKALIDGKIDQKQFDTAHNDLESIKVLVSTQYDDLKDFIEESFALLSQRLNNKQ